jgi:hypothetical protein
MRCEGSGDRDKMLMLRAFEVGYRRGVETVYGWLGLEPPNGIGTRAMGWDELRRRMQSLEDESVRHYD